MPDAPTPVDRTRTGAIDEDISTAQRRGLQRLLAALGALPEAVADFTDKVTARCRPSMFGFTPKEGRYRREAEITRGGMGAICRVIDQDLDRPSAMKILLPDMLQDPHSMVRFVAEARITALLEHPNIVPVHDIGETKADGTFFTMKLVAGEPLSDILHRLARNDMAYVERYDRHALLVIFRKVCDAVAFAHSRGVIHRDIKPHNIMVGRYGEVLLMDWGLAKFVHQQTADGPGVRAPVKAEAALAGTTTQGVIKGTPSYMAPEQACGRATEIDEQTDIFLLGATLYHVLTFFPPYMGSDTDEIVLKAAQGRIIPPNERHRAQQIPDELCRIVMKATAARKASRYVAVEDLIADLDAWMAGRTLYQNRTFAPGEYLMRAGERGAEGYLLLSGAVDVFKVQDGKRIHLTTLGPGDTVGEMAIITDEARSASVVARETTQVQVITRQVMHEQLRKMPPWMDGVVTALVQRLRTANARVHPLLTEGCVPNVLIQLCLLAFSTAGKCDQAEDQAIELPLGITARLIGTNLGLPLARVDAAMRALDKERVVDLSEDGRIRIPSLAQLSRFAAYCEQRLSGSRPEAEEEPHHVETASEQNAFAAILDRLIAEWGKTPVA